MRTLIPTLLVFLAACGTSLELGGDASPITLGVDPDVASPGATVELTLTNSSADPIGYNLCTSGLERRDGGDWEPVASNRVCTMELRTLEPGSAARYSYELPAGLASGEYRFTTTAENLTAGGRTGVRSEAFTVR